MAVVATPSNHFKYQLADGKIDLDTDTLKIILMNNTFAFNKDDDATLAGVTGDQLSTANGYTQDDETLGSVAISEDDTNDRMQMTCDDPSWTASGGSIGATGAAIIYDDTTSDDTVIGCIDFGTDYTIGDGESFTVKDIIINLA